jgi:FkbM family methyltransferase
MLHNGFITIPLAKTAKPKAGVVHSFEAQRMLYYALCGTAALNDLENILFYNVAVGATIGHITVPKPDYSQPQDFDLYSLRKEYEGLARETVALVTIDSLNFSR